MNQARLLKQDEEDKKPQALPQVGAIADDALTNDVLAAKRSRHLVMLGAYAQHLAEICDTIMNDARWRVSGKTLLRWESGDDLSLVSALAMVAQQTEDQHTDVSCLNLFSRCFYRKGPWFRLDDCYMRYYVINEARRQSPPPKENIQAARGRVDEQLVQHHKKLIAYFIEDLSKLKGEGWIRTFLSHRECAEAIDGSSLLRADERSIVFELLGARKKGDKSWRKSLLSYISNQQTIFSHLPAYSESSLPVIDHVENVVIHKLASTIIDHCCSQGTKPSVAETEKETGRLSNFIKRLCRQKLSIPFSCFRARESPLLALQRCVRLYRCCEGGPGSMRGDGTNGWKSLLCVKAKKIPFFKLIPPPSINSFHRMDYPGLQYRFGRYHASCSHLFKCYRDVKTLRSSVFPSDASFHAWEWGVECRAQIDYLCELNEKLRIEERRPSKDSRSTISEHPHDTVDFHGILTSHGRQVFCSRFLDKKECFSPGHDSSKLCDKIEELVRNIFETDIKHESERVLCTFGVVLSCILAVSVSGSNGHQERPSWLRHMSWQSCLAYAMWDTIPYLERNALYQEALQALSVLVVGSHHVPVCSRSAQHFAPFGWLSRRARGKAVERIAIDFAHLYRLTPQKRKSPDASAFRNEIQCANSNVQASVVSFCTEMIDTRAPAASLPFCAIRSLARRLKRPLCETLSDVSCLEAALLGHRTSNGTSPASGKETGAKYTDWVPPTDRLEANAIGRDSDGPGRCSFIGFEAEDGIDTSLNVEELALQLYDIGRLPAHEGNVGGWKGWHNEGAHIRALFRILVGTSVIFAEGERDSNETSDASLIVMSPYQQVPFDLHVGFEVGNQETSFYGRRHEKIESFLSFIENSSPIELCDRVYDAIKNRYDQMESSGKFDAQLQIDVLNLRTLSAIAAGCGGKQLAGIFRCLLFDYRHYSGGFPDLLMIRACFEGIVDKKVDLAEWVGESFSKEFKDEVESRLGASMLLDNDDEYLGCSKSGESGATHLTRKRAIPGVMNKAVTKLPERLFLAHDGKQVKVESLFVEVKSANDRLDPRQEDWLNVLDLLGSNARVCKFEKVKD